MTTFLLVLVFGVLGVSLRYFALQITHSWGAEASIYTIFMCNLLGCFAIGALFSFKSINPAVTHSLVLAVGVGLLGGFTTFSTYSWDTLRLLMNGEWGKAVLYFVASPITGLLSCWLGFQTVKWVGSISG